MYIAKKSIPRRTFLRGIGATIALPLLEAMVPAATQKPVVDKIHQWFVQMVSSDDTRKFLNSFGGDPYINTPEQAQALFERDVKAWGEYVRLAKIEPM